VSSAYHIELAISTQTRHNARMPKRSSKKQPDDVQPVSPDLVAEATVQPVPAADEQPATGKNPAAVALGRLGGLKGGKARAKKLTKKQRQEIAQKAALARWRKKLSSPSPPPPLGESQGTP
jgi:hypothetical protein